MGVDVAYPARSGVTPEAFALIAVFFCCGGGTPSLFVEVEVEVEA
jgi:hypothetical protein